MALQGGSATLPGPPAIQAGGRRRFVGQPVRPVWRPTGGLRKAGRWWPGPGLEAAATPEAEESIHQGEAAGEPAGPGLPEHVRNTGGTASSLM